MTLGLQLIATPQHTNLKKQQQIKRRRELCVEAVTFIWTAGISKKLACRTEGTADPDFDNFERLLQLRWHPV